MDNFKFLYDTQNLEFHVMKKEDGTSVKYTADHGGMVMHSGNSYIDEDNNYVYDTEMFVKSEENPFICFDLNWLHDPDRRVVSYGSVMRRYKINLDTGVIAYEDLLVSEKDGAGFIMINPEFQGKKHNFTYIISMEFSKRSYSIL